jgi:hypothetical protein
MVSHPVAPHVHLFDGNRLVATVRPTVRALQREYLVDGRTYQAISYTEVTEQTGEIGYDVQVARPSDEASVRPVRTLDTP